MGYRYVVLGAGRQGVAAAYDLARHGEAEKITLVDRNVAIARGGAERLNRLVGGSVAEAAEGDASQPKSLAQPVGQADGLLSAASYRFNLGLARLAVETGTHMVDLGGHTGIVRDQLALDQAAKDAGIALVPDCGMGPGMNVTLALAAMDLLDEAEEVRIYDGGLPEHPRPPWNYALFFSAEGLVNEYGGEAHFLRGGKVTPVAALEELEIPPLGRLEAFLTSGGLFTMPSTFAGRLRVLEDKTLRYPGHCLLLRGLGLFSREPIPVWNTTIVPRDLLIALFDRSFADSEARDVCLIHVRARGKRNGRPAEARVDLVDRYDPATGFRAMEKLTGWHAAIVLSRRAGGDPARGDPNRARSSRTSVPGSSPRPRLVCWAGCRRSAMTRWPPRLRLEAVREVAQDPGFPVCTGQPAAETQARAPAPRSSWPKEGSQPWGTTWTGGFEVHGLAVVNPRGVANRSATFHELLGLPPVTSRQLVEIGFLVGCDELEAITSLGTPRARTSRSSGDLP